MRAAAAADRLRRALGSLSVRYTAALQPTAETVGRGLGLSDDAISLFSEEVCVVILSNQNSSLCIKFVTGFTAAKG